jgi:hypothetical protein
MVPPVVKRPEALRISVELRVTEPVRVLKAVTAPEALRAASSQAEPFQMYN